jgi:hypothetical protein
MEIEYKSIRIWYKALCEILDGYAISEPLDRTIGMSEVRAIALKNQIKDLLVSHNLDLEENITLKNNTKQIVPVIILVIQNVLENIPEWELPLRLDATKDELLEEIKKMKSIK